MDGLLFGLLTSDLFWFFVVVGIVGGTVYLVKRSKTNTLDLLFWKKFALGSAIALVFPAMIAYGIQTFSERPDRDDYVTIVDTQRWDTAIDKNSKEYEEKVKEFDKQQQIYKDALVFYETMIFIAWVIGGFLAIGGGIFLKIPAAGTGFMWGGIFSVLTGYLEYVAYMSDALMFISAVLALAGFVIIAYKKFGKSLEE